MADVYVYVGVGVAAGVEVGRRVKHHFLVSCAKSAYRTLLICRHKSRGAFETAREARTSLVAAPA